MYNKWKEYYVIDNNMSGDLKEMVDYYLFVLSSM